MNCCLTLTITSITIITIMNIFPKPKLLAIGQLNEKSQLVIPKDAREAIGIGPGDRVVIALAPFANVLVIARPEDLEEHLKDMVATSAQSAKDIKHDLDNITKKDMEK